VQCNVVVRADEHEDGICGWKIPLHRRSQFTGESRGGDGGNGSAMRERGGSRHKEWNLGGFCKNPDRDY
jgi:hypothetical protein